MRLRGNRWLAGFVYLGGAIALVSASILASIVFAQEATTPAPAAQSTPIIRTEKRLVLVDTVVTDKKGNYVRDLTAKDFRVWDDNKEQAIESFSSEADPSSSNAQNHYLILFFDNSTMKFGDQMQARQAAIKFLDANAGPKRLVAIVNFGGSLQLAQNFTDDKERLKQVVNGVKFSSVSPNPQMASLGAPALGAAAADFGARDVLLAIRSLAKSLSSIPGRKTLVFLSAGFPLDSELRSELTAVIDVCNKANVAIYPIDIRGLVTAGPLGLLFGAPSGSQDMRMVPAEFRATEGASLEFASYAQPAAFVSQHGTSGGGSTGGGGGTRGGAPVGGGTGARSGTPTSGGGRGGTTGAGNVPANASRGIFGQQNPFAQPRSIVPKLPDVTSQQDVLYALASGTGGFVIANTNDLLGGLQKIGSEQNEYYVLGYSPAESKEGTCHEIKVKVDRGGTSVRSRSGYCNVKPVDLLAGTAVEKNLETRASAAAPGNVNASMELPFFYTSPNTARVNVAMDIAPTGLEFAKEKGKLHAEMHVLGIASDKDGTVAARFSDTVKFDFENKKELKAFQEQPLHYETQFDIASGQYDLKVAFSSGGANFGKVQMPLTIDPYDGQKFSLSGVALSNSIRKVGDLDISLDAALLDDQKPLVSKGMQFTPSGSNIFKKTETTVVYLEVYEPLLLQPNTPKVGLQMRLLDRKSGEQKLDTGFFNVLSYSKTGNPVIPVVLKLPVETLAAGSYRAEFKAIDEAGHATMVRSADFVVE